MHILEMFLVSLALTLVIETAVAFFMGVRMPGLKIVWMVNLLTNPAAVCGNWLLGMMFPMASLFLRQLPIEAAVILIEVWIYLSFAKEERWGIRKPVTLAVIANLASYCGGLLLR